MKATIQKLTQPAQSSFIYQVKISSQFRFNWHFHPEYELTYIDRSHGKRFVGDNIANYGDGDLVLLGANLPHTWQSTSQKPRQHKAYIIQFGEGFLGRDGLACVELRHVRRLLERSARGLHFYGRVCHVAARRIKALKDTSGLQRLTGLLEVLDLLGRSRSCEEISSAGFVPAMNIRQHRRIDRVLQYISTHFRENISQAEVAALVEMSPALFSRFFKRTVGMTFVKYVNNLRISHSCQLLIDTELPILEISHRAGFSNLSNFNRRFLEAKELTPRQFRCQFQCGSIQPTF